MALLGSGIPICLRAGALPFSQSRLPAWGYMRKRRSDGVCRSGVANARKIGKRCAVGERNLAAAHGNANRRERGEIARQVLWCHPEVGCQYAFAIGKDETAVASGVLVGAQYPF